MATEEGSDGSSEQVKTLSLYMQPLHLRMQEPLEHHEEQQKQGRIPPSNGSDETQSSEKAFIGEKEQERTLLFSTEEQQKLSLGELRAMAVPDIDEASFKLSVEDDLQMLPLKRVTPRRQEAERPVNGRGRLSIQNVGGSLSILLQIALLAWGVRQLRSVIAKRRQKQAPRINTMPFRPVDPPLYTSLSVSAFNKLLETNPTPYLIIDVRFPEAVQTDPFFPKNTINVPEPELSACLQLSEADWKSRFPFVRSISRTQLLIFLSNKSRRAQRAAALAAELGYNGCCVLLGGIHGFQMASQTVEQYQPRYLSRDAVAILLQEARGIRANVQFVMSTYLIDLRRHDERALYGHIHGSIHIPVFEWPKALVMEERDWEKLFHCQKFQKDDLVILYGRANNESSWAAQVAYDVEMKRCYVCKGGVVDWLLDFTVHPYNAYNLGDPPPDPIMFEVENINYKAAYEELLQAGLH